MDTAKRSVGSSHGVPPIANAMETPLSALVVLPSRSLRRVLIPPICELIPASYELVALISVKDARPRPAAVLVPRWRPGPRLGRWSGRISGYYRRHDSALLGLSSGAKERSATARCGDVEKQSRLREV